MTQKIDKKSYDKKSIITAIEKNFELNQKRTIRDEQNVLHHSLHPNFTEYHKVNFDTLIPIYKKILQNMLKKIKLVSATPFHFSIVNYTCLSHGESLKPHIHGSGEFTAVHYLQFDKKQHTPTMFENTLPYADYLMHLRPKLPKLLSSQEASNSWAYMDWSLDVEEDDFYFAPAYLKHRVDAQNSEGKNRITVVLNIILG